MKKKIYIGVIVIILLFASYFYWQNRYVEFRPVILAEENYSPQLIFFDNDLYKFAEPNEISPNYYKNIKFVLDRSGQPYIEKNGIIYVRNHYLNDMNLMWNYTTRSTNPTWFKLKREMDSINGDHESKEKLDSIIKGFIH
ncbi:MULTISPECIES: hypothetical protein [unclassified Flavobacterium]|uniref:hypothetical protein n=1 Tax=unclassified Flavobacterium TaxID=196869 RepID=UPI00057EA85E|nr:MULTISPECIES: hypothetical protein [unclassified Flavobacterium]KIA93635.1 hypothetical protein OA93_21780 [Flavobacterium sp. KMS]MEA9412809.1 hypothetical protein [Flavobacterium sp. PL02]